MISGHDAMQSEQLFLKHVGPNDAFVQADVAGARTCFVRNPSGDVDLSSGPVRVYEIRESKMNMIQCSVILALARVMKKNKDYVTLHLHCHCFFVEFLKCAEGTLPDFFGSYQVERYPQPPYEKLERWPYVTVAHGTSRL